MYIYIYVYIYICIYALGYHGTATEPQIGDCPMFYQQDLDLQIPWDLMGPGPELSGDATNICF